MLSVGVLAFALLAPLLAFGAVTDWGLAVALGASVLWAGYVSWLRARAPTGWSVRLASAALWGAVVWCGLQLLPLPATILRRLTPHGAEIWSKAERLLGDAASSHPITVDPPATAFMLVVAICVALTFTASVRYASDKDARVRLLYAVVLAVVVLDLVAIAHRAAGLDKVFGVYAPRYATGRIFVSPLMNTNHAAAVAGIAPPVLVGLALDGKFGARALAALGVVTSGAVAILSLSRSGMLVFALEMAAMTVYALTKRGTIQQRTARAAFAGLATAGALAAAFLVGSEHIVTKATNVNTSKLRVPLQATKLVRDFFWTGAGRGAFETTFPAYELGLPGAVRYTHVENWPMQIASDFGVPFTILFVALLTMAVASSKRAFERPTYVGAVVALVGLVIHDLFDFSMEFAATAMLAAPLLATVTTAGLRREAPPPPHTRWFLPIVAALGAIVGGLALREAWAHRLDEDQTAVTSLTSTPAGDALGPAIASALRRHPADPHFYALEGVRRLRDVAAGAFLVRSVERGPNRGMTHVWLARWFALHGRKPQAWAELRGLLAIDPAYAPTVVVEMVRLDAEIAELEAVVTDEVTAGLVASHLDARGRKAEAEAMDASTIARFPPAMDARIRQIRRARGTDQERARRLAREMLALSPKTSEAWLLAAELEPTDLEAEKTLLAAKPVLGDDVAILEALTRRRGLRLGVPAIADDLARLQIAYEAIGAPPAKLPVLKAEIELARNRPSAALRYFLDAAAAAPEELSYLERAATLASSTGQTALAQSLWSRLVTMRPEDPRYRDGLQAAAAAASSYAPLPVPSTGPSTGP